MTQQADVSEALPIDALIRQREYILDRIEGERSRFKSTISGLQNGLEHTERLIEQHSADDDAGRIQRAERVLEIVGAYDGSGDQSQAVNDAIKDIARGGLRLFREYFGTKNYAEWKSQRADFPYGYGPAHGSTNFSVGIQDVRRGGEDALDSDERDACIYFLHVMLKKRIVRAST